MQIRPHTQWGASFPAEILKIHEHACNKTPVPSTQTCLEGLLLNRVACFSSKGLRRRPVRDGLKAGGLATCQPLVKSVLLLAQP